MNPALALVMVIAGGALLVVAALGHVLGWFAMSVAIALGGVGILLDTAGALMFVAARRGERARR
jgi:hypothetical protein